MNESLDILEIVSQPWLWVPELDGTPTRGAGRFVQPAGHGLQTRNGDWNAGLRHLSYAFVSKGPDVLYDRIAVDIRQLLAVLADIEAAVFRTICGQPGGDRALRRAGESLTRLVMPGWVFERLLEMPEGAPLAIRPDELAAAIPYELCYAPAQQCFLGQRLALSRGVACRRSPDVAARQPVGAPDGCIGLSEGAVLLNPESDPRLASLALSVSKALDELPPASANRLALYAESPFAELLAGLSAPWLLYTGHIRYDETDGSYIQCADGNRLTAAEVAGRLAVGVRPHCVVLNGCGGDRTALTAAVPGDGAGRIGFARAFYEAGVDIVVGSRWEIDIETACALNTHILRALTDPDAVSIGEVLRRFRLGDAPGWAGYTLHGDPRRILRLVPPPPVPTGASAAEPSRRNDPVAITENVVPVVPEALPTRAAPLPVGLLLDTGPTAHPAEQPLYRRFIAALAAELTDLDARLAPHGRGSVSRLCAVGWPRPLGKTPEMTPQALRVGLRPRKSDDTAAMAGGGGPAPALARLVAAMMRDHKPGGDAPAPLVILLLGASIGDRAAAAGPGGPLADLVLLCDDLRAGGAPAIFPPPAVWPIALGSAVPDELLLTLAGGNRGHMARIREPAEAVAVVTRMFAPLHAAYLVRSRGRGARETQSPPASHEAGAVTIKE
jgi:hypothetical protein